MTCVGTFVVSPIFVYLFVLYGRGVPKLDEG